MKKQRIFGMAALLLLTAAGCSRAAEDSVLAEEAAPGTLTVSLDYQRQRGYATNQFAVWIEDGEGNVLRTLCATEFTATGGWEKRPDALPRWVERAGLAEKTAEEVDALATATPKSGALQYRWDCTDAAGNDVKGAPCTVYIEGTLRWRERVLYTVPAALGDEAWRVEAQPEYTAGAEEEREMLSNVAVEWNP